MKDFNNLCLNGKIYSKQELLEQTVNDTGQAIEHLDFWLFISQWFNEKAYIEVSSSGSTDKAKIIQIPKKKMIASAAMTCQFFNLKKGASALLCLSAKHIGGMMMIVRAMHAEFNLLITTASANPLKTLHEKIDFIALVPYQAKTILKENPESLASIANIIIGGGKIDYELQQALLENQLTAYSTFGMTETISHIALQKIGSETYYTCLDGIHVEQSSRGTLIVNAPILLDEALETNDLITLVSSKKFKWLGRTDFAIESGGLKFIPEQIEQKLEAKIQERFIISSRPHPLLNNELILLIEGTERVLDPTIFAGLEKYEKPKKVYFISKFAETATGKINRIQSQKLI